MRLYAAKLSNIMSKHPTRGGESERLSIYIYPNTKSCPSDVGFLTPLLRPDPKRPERTNWLRPERRIGTLHVEASNKLSQMKWRTQMGLKCARKNWTLM